MSVLLAPHYQTVEFHQASKRLIFPHRWEAVVGKDITTHLLLWNLDLHQSQVQNQIVWPLYFDFSNLGLILIILLLCISGQTNSKMCFQV